MYADAKGHAKLQTLQAGDSVLVRAPKVNKFSSYYDPVPYKVTDVKGSMITAARPGHTITSNTSFFKKISARSPDKLRKNKTLEFDQFDMFATENYIMGYHYHVCCIELATLFPRVLQMFEHRNVSHST